MKRLTKMRESPYVGYELKNDSAWSKIVAINKLGMLEDLEEQLGMSLEDFYKCMFHNGDWFYIIIENDDTEQLEIVEVEKEEDYMNQYCQGIFYFTGESEKGISYEYPITSYGQNLFFTSEEAEKKLEEIKVEKLKVEKLKAGKLKAGKYEFELLLDERRISNSEYEDLLPAAKKFNYIARDKNSRDHYLYEELPTSPIDIEGNESILYNDWVQLPIFGLICFITLDGKKPATIKEILEEYEKERGR